MTTGRPYGAVFRRGQDQQSEPIAPGPSNRLAGALACNSPERSKRMSTIIAFAIVFAVFAGLIWLCHKFPTLGLMLSIFSLLG